MYRGIQASSRTSAPRPWAQAVLKTLAICAAFAVGGCALFGGLRANAVASTAEPPANVAVYLSVRDGDEPITDLSAGNFQLLENGQPLSSTDTGLTLLQRDTVALHRVLLLVDISTAKDAGTRVQLSRGVASFVDAVRKAQAVTVMAFDGSAEPRLVAEYPQGAGDKLERVAALEPMAPKDPSRNLHGAVLHGIKHLDARLMSAKKPIRVGTLVIFTAGPDLAARVQREEAEEKIRNSPHHVLSIIVANEATEPDLGELAKDGLVRAPSVQMAGIGLDEASRKVNALEQQYYLLSYCSPARAGMRRLTIDVKRTTLEGDEQNASAEVDFNAAGFGPGCDPARIPRFASGTAPVSVEPPPGEEAPQQSATDPKAPPKDAPPKDTPPNGQDKAAPPPDLPGYAPLPNKPK